MKKRIQAVVSFAAVLSLAVACTTNTTNLNTNSGVPANNSAPAELKAAFDSITANDILQHTKVLSADEYEGRGPGTKGEELTVKYLTEQFQRIGLKRGIRMARLFRRFRWLDLPANQVLRSRPGASK